ncbi:hypothetical protein LPJ75_001940 [Coemansia sp. RSA 2598]|nr:hypothetical protein LPJ75_001940 [Coemansia sp. RSA 2598]
MREFAVRYGTEPQHRGTNADVDVDVVTPNKRPANPHSTKHSKPSIPVVSITDIVTSLLEEKRFEDGIRFLTTIGYDALVEDEKVIANLLDIFKSTDYIENELKRRSSYLILEMDQSLVDISTIWKIDDQRRQLIVRSQQAVLTYMSSVKTVYIKRWFASNFARSPGDFWDYLEELVTQPQSDGSDETRLLEIEMYQNRMTLACLLAEQICMDLADHIDDMWGTVFMNIASEGYATSEYVSYPKRLLSAIFDGFDNISYEQCPVEQKRIVQMLLDMASVAISSDVISRDNFVQAIAKKLLNFEPAKLLEFVGLCSSDMLVIDVISYILVTWYRFEEQPGNQNVDTGRASSIASMPSGFARTAEFVRTARPPAKKDPELAWRYLVCALSLLVQRTMNAFDGRMCRANRESVIGSSSSYYPVLMVVGNHPSAATLLQSAYKALESRVLDLVPHPAAAAADTEGAGDSSQSAANDKDDGSKDNSRSRSKSRRKQKEQDRSRAQIEVHQELQFLGSFLSQG